MLQWCWRHLLPVLWLLMTCYYKCSAVTVTAQFNMHGVDGTVSFSQSSAKSPTYIEVTLSGLGQYPAEMFPWHVHKYPYMMRPDPCSAASVGGHFDPFMARSRSDYSSACSPGNTSLCEVGDLSGKFGGLRAYVIDITFVDYHLSLYGVYSIVGRSLVIHRGNGDRWVCANIGYPSDVIVAYSPFRSVLVGSVFFIEPYSPMNLTSVFARLSYISGPVNSTAHNWLVHAHSIGNDSTCRSTGSHYNPRELDIEFSDYSYCNATNQTACEIGDLSGKSSRLDFISGQTKVFYTDIELPVTVNTLEETILNRSVVVHESDAKSVKKACANLIEYASRIAIVRFKEDGVMGQIVFHQVSPFSTTTVSVNLNGLANRAGGYHVHEFPVDETIPGSEKCASRFAGGHFNPRNVLRDSSSPMTFDAYEVGDLSGKYGSLANMTSINSSYSDAYLPLFGVESIVGRSVVIHYPNGSRWLCANIVYDMATVSLTANINSGTYEGRIVLTQLASDPFSETTIFSDIRHRKAETTALIDLSTSMPAAESSISISTSLVPVVTSTIESISMSTWFTASVSSVSTSISPSTTSTASVIDSSISSTSLPQSSASSITISSSTVSLMSTGVRSSVSASLSTNTAVATTTGMSSTVDIGSGFLSTLDTNSPSPTPTPDDKPDGRRKKEVRRQTPSSGGLIYLSVQSNCSSGAVAVNPYSAPQSCSPANPLACPIGDLTGKHGALSGRALLTDLNLPLTGPNSVAGKGLVVKIGNASLPCVLLTLSMIPTTSSATFVTQSKSSTAVSSPVSTTVGPSVSSTPQGSSSGSNKTIIIAITGAAFGVLASVLLVVVVWCCVRRRRRRSRSADFVTQQRNETDGYKPLQLELHKKPSKKKKSSKNEEYVEL